jgi:4,5-DOPA dioxygenase extradiol
MSLNQTLCNLRATFPDSDQKMPVLLVGHGNPMNALEDTEYSRAWAEVGKSLPRPSAILCISAPTNEHYLPLLDTLSLQEKNEQVEFFADRVTMGSLSMRSLWIQ